MPRRGRGSGRPGELHEVQRAYARALGFHIDACAPREANAKGKVEAKVRLGRLRADPTVRRFEGMEELQGWSGQRLKAWSKSAICPAMERAVVNPSHG